MRCGISTSCFYPENTLTALQHVAQCNVDVVEIFFNMYSELEDSYIEKLLDVVHAANIQVVSIHPFSSFMEGYLFASEYSGRFEEGITLYRRMFEVAVLLGANKVVFHGDYAGNIAKISHQEYAKRFMKLALIAQEYGVMLCHENVSYCRLGAPEAVEILKQNTQDTAKFVLDTKQARRNDVDVFAMLAAMKGSLQHIHISDFDSNNYCLPPGSGKMDFSAFFGELYKIGYTGDLIIELYRDNFGTIDELIKSVAFLKPFCNKIMTNG